MPDTVDKVQEVKAFVAGEIDTIRKDLQNVERTVSEQVANASKRPVDKKDVARHAIMQAWRGDQNAIKNLDSGFLREDIVSEIVRPDEYFDLIAHSYVKTVVADSTNLGVAANSGLSRGAESASDFAAVSIAVPMPLTWQYKGYSVAEFANSNLSMVDENVKAYFANRKQSLAKEFVDGDGTTELKGLETYVASTTWETNKLQTYTATANTAASLLPQIVAARNALEPGKKIFTCSAAVKTLLEADRLTTGASRFETHADGTIWYENMEFWQNDNFSSADDHIVGAVFVDQRGYGLGINPTMIASAADVGSKKNLYLGQGLGGAAVVSGASHTMKCIAAVALNVT